MKKMFIGLVAALVVLAPTVRAQANLPDPGITPDSPFYFMDRAFDRFQSSEAVADERASEIQAMAEKNKTRAMEKAAEGYQRAMQRRERDANRSEEVAEEVARQASNHMSVLSQVKEKVPEEAHKGIETAMNNSARARERGIRALNKTNRERARSVAQNTLEEVMANAPEEAKEGLQNAMNAVRNRGPPRNVVGPSEGNETEEETPGAPEEGEQGQPEEGGNQTPEEENTSNGDEPVNSTGPNEAPTGQ